MLHLPKNKNDPDVTLICIHCEFFKEDDIQLECRDCEFIQECRGGCRFRAKQYKNILAPDPLMCHANGVPRV